jgi:hypothetical protein
MRVLRCWNRSFRLSEGIIVDLSTNDVSASLRAFKMRRDDLLHDDTATFDHNFERFIAFCRSDPLARKVLGPIESKSTVDLDAWWTNATQHQPKITIPVDPDEELSLRYRLQQSVEADGNRIFQLGIAHNAEELDGWIDLFRTLIIRLFAEELSRRLGEAADLATPEARALQAVPLVRIPSNREVKVFLSHKSIDKPVVYRYYHALKTLGFDPWLDETAMSAGANLEREVLRGFEESCAAVFFLTASYKDEKYLAAEVDYAIMQKRKKDKKFAIVNLRYPDAAAVPPLLTPFIYKDVANDLEGFDTVLKGLPIELGPVRWKAHVA